MLTNIRVVAAALLLPLGGMAQAQSIQCGTNYVTQSGDFLARIAEQASAPDQRVTYQDIVDFNSGSITNPNRIPIGLEIFIPCATPVSIGTATAGTLQESQGTEFSLLTGVEFAPYVDEGLLNGGLSSHLIEAALQENGGQLDYEIVTVGDWGAHLRDLLGRGAFDLGYPWYKPNCSNYSRLLDEGKWRCDNLRFGEVLHQVVVGYYMRAGEAQNVSVPADLAGRTLCRPKGFFTHDLASAGLLSEDDSSARLVMVDSPEDCFERLIDGSVDVVTINVDTSEATIDQLAIANEVTEVIPLSTIETLHVVAMIDNPRARVLLRRIDQGLFSLRESGQDRAIIRQHQS